MLTPFPSLSLDPSSRVDPYRFAHKAIRVLLGRLLETTGRTDFADPAAVERLHRQTIEAVELLRTHARIEVQFLDTLIGAYAPSEANGIQREHAELEHELFLVVEELDLAAKSRDAQARGHAFYLGLSRFVAHYLLHIADEELRVLPLLHRHVDEIVLRRAMLAAQSSIRYEERAKTFVLVLDAIAPHERAALVGSSRALDPRAVVSSRPFEAGSVEETEGAIDTGDEAGVLQRS